MIILPTILCGGAGSRLWPVSRALHPKPFIRLHDNQSLLQKAFLRAIHLPHVTDVLTVTNKELVFKIQDEYLEVRDVNVSTHFILEPSGRNTAPAMASAALLAAEQYGDDVVMLVLPADHLIADEKAFRESVLRAAELARMQRLVTFGIEPTLPEIGYGYIEVDMLSPLFSSGSADVPTGYDIVRFVEKPNLNTAEQYIESGNYLWNSGMFCFTAGCLLTSMAQVCPDILQKTRECWDASHKTQKKTSHFVALDGVSFDAVPSISFDYAVMEPMSTQEKNRVAVVPSALGWSDVGSWSTLGDLVEADSRGNRVVGESLLKDTDNCYVYSNTRLIGTVGLNNLIIVDTPDAILVADRSAVQDVKHIYDSLKAQNHETHKLHRTVHRPWGTYTVLEVGDNFKIKRIEVKPGERLSLQMHHHRSEHWIVVQGTAKVTNGDDEFLVRTNQSTYIPAGHQHRLENPGVVQLVLIEVQSGEYLGEDDIVRFEDNYGRVEV